MAETREKLLGIAFMEFLQHTYKDVTLDHLVKELGLTKGAFYHHFRSKNDLFVQVVDLYLNGFNDFYNHPYDRSKSFVDNLMIMVERSISRMNELKSEMHGGFDEINFYGFILDAMKYYPEFRENVGRLYKEKELQLYARFINEAKCNKELKMSVDSMMLAEIIANLFDGISINKYLMGKEKNITESIRNSLYFICELAAK